METRYKTLIYAFTIPEEISSCILVKTSAKDTISMVIHKIYAKWLRIQDEINPDHGLPRYRISNKKELQIIRENISDDCPKWFLFGFQIFDENLNELYDDYLDPEGNLPTINPKTL